MHQIEPYAGWLKFYDSANDQYSPFHGKEYNFDLYSDTIYGYYIDPGWDFFGSETLYMKVLFVDYERNFAILEFIGEWNDAINNDVMHLKRNIIEAMQMNFINKFILIGGNVLNFHGSDDSYYEEWFDEVTDNDGWIVGVNFLEHVTREWSNYNIDSYICEGPAFQINNWRTMLPFAFFQKVEKLVQNRIELT